MNPSQAWNARPVAAAISRAGKAGVASEFLLDAIAELTRNTIAYSESLRKGQRRVRVRCDNVKL